MYFLVRRGDTSKCKLIQTSGRSVLHIKRSNERKCVPRTTNDFYMDVPNTITICSDICLSLQSKPPVYGRRREDAEVTPSFPIFPSSSRNSTAIFPRIISEPDINAHVKDTMYTHTHTVSGTFTHFAMQCVANEMDRPIRNISTILINRK